MFHHICCSFAIRCRFCTGLLDADVNIPGLKHSGPHCLVAFLSHNPTVRKQFIFAVLIRASRSIFVCISAPLFHNTCRLTGQPFSVSCIWPLLHGWGAEWRLLHNGDKIANTFSSIISVDLLAVDFHTAWLFSRLAPRRGALLVKQCGNLFQSWPIQLRFIFTLPLIVIASGTL